jgi:hypothetical protein
MLFFILSLLQEQEEIRYSQVSTVAFDWDELQADTLIFQDTLTANDLYQMINNEGIPLFYGQDIVTEVCFDDKCRLLRISVYWNITGRYLGFRLVDGEFLSKKEHEAFSNEEYEKLNALLADPSLPLGEVSFEKLIMNPAVNLEEVDGVTGATTADVSKMVVKGAAYTTFTLWNIVHGPTKEVVSNLTEELLSPDLIALILNSPDISDRVWALNRLDQGRAMGPKLTESVLEIVNGDDFFLSYSAVNAIGSSHLISDSLQIALWSIYTDANNSIQRMLVEKLMEAPHLSSEVINSSRKLLGALNGKQLGDFLKLYTKHGVYDKETIKVVGGILKNENSFISRQAAKFLKESPLSDSDIEQLRNK